jgi:DNA repair exonuclease SbcCD ATPase subunit
VDLSLQELSLNGTVERLRKALTNEPIDKYDISAPASASQRVIDLKERRHKLSDELHSFRTQREMASGLVGNLEHRIHAADDLLRLKTTGVGRLDHLECPTCHRDLDPTTFALTEQTKESISTHIEALKRDRDLMKRNVDSIDSDIATTSSTLFDVEDELREAERTLTNVTSAVGAVREQIAQIASELNRAERGIDRIHEISREIDELQAAVNRWISDASALGQAVVTTPDLKSRRDAFLNALRKYLVALGHSAMGADSQAVLTFDEQYIPFLNNRRLRALGSASDQPRLVAAYSLALTAVSRQIAGLHPGLVILDEPLQQNPDPHHREMFIAFLSQELARNAQFQTLIFTSLREDEIERLRGQGTNVLLPEGEHFLKLVL